MGLTNILCQDITSTTTALFLIERLKTNFNEISFENIHMFREEIEKTVYAKQEPFFFRSGYVTVEREGHVMSTVSGHASH